MTQNSFGIWQLIETAPKDKEILVTGGVYWDSGDTYITEHFCSHVEMVRWDDMADAWRGDCSGQYGEYFYYKPKYWTPVPEVPQDIRA